MHKFRRESNAHSECCRERQKDRPDCSRGTRHRACRVGRVPRVRSGAPPLESIRERWTCRDVRGARITRFRRRIPARSDSRCRQSGVSVDKEIHRGSRDGAVRPRERGHHPGTDGTAGRVCTIATGALFLAAAVGNQRRAETQKRGDADLVLKSNQVLQDACGCTSQWHCCICSCRCAGTGEIVVDISSAAIKPTWIGNASQLARKTEKVKICIFIDD